MINKRIQKKDWIQWLLWILSSAVGFSAGIGLSLAAPASFGEIPSSVALGVVIGLAQWLLLRKRFQISGWWILITALGITLGFVETKAIHSAFLGARGLLLPGALGLAALGLVVGAFQWGILRKYLRKAGWWVILNGAGWLVGGIVTWTVRLQFIEFVKIIADYAILGLIAGIGTGLALILVKERQTPLEETKISSFRNLAIATFALILIVFASVLDAPGRSRDDFGTIPDLGSAPQCSHLPPVDCDGDDAFCVELIPFEPITGDGYSNYPVNDETWDDQFRSFLRRDLMMLIKYASAKVACETDSWDYRAFHLLGLGDMSEGDGAIPGTSTGNLDHPWGTHQEGNDIDVAYFQTDLETPLSKLENRWHGLEEDLLRPVCKYTRFGMNVYHCTEPPGILDPWRTALFIAYLTENPYLRVIGVDGKIGPVLEEALDQLVMSGWIDSDLRDRIPLMYEVTPEGMGWFKFHHHHMHISMNPR